jgi:hypothetical protein
VKSVTDTPIRGSRRISPGNASVSKDTWTELRMVRMIPAALLLSLVALAQRTATPYPSMAPLDQHLIADRNAEIVLARTAAPNAISDNVHHRISFQNH